MPGSHLAGTFTDEDALLAATREARKEGLAIVDAYTPYPVHGMDEAMGLPPTRLTYVCFGLGVIGLVFATSFQLWAHGVSWPINIGGKSFTAFPATVPVTFEVMVLFAAIGSVIAFFLRFGLLPGRSVRLPATGITDDRFVLVLDPGDATDSARKILEGHGSTEIQEVTP